MPSVVARPPTSSALHSVALHSGALDSDVLDSGVLDSGALDSGTAARSGPAPSLNDADIQQVALGGWRVSDRLVDPADRAYLLGFIERRDDRFEAMQIGTEFVWTTFDTMPEALHHLLTEGRSAAGRRGTGDMSWLAALPASSFDEL